MFITLLKIYFVFRFIQCGLIFLIILLLETARAFEHDNMAFSWIVALLSILAYGPSIVIEAFDNLSEEE